MKINAESSYHLNLIRLLAAQAVVLGHTLGLLGIETSFTYMASIAVVVFFILSGYLISCSAYSLKQKGGGFREFFIHRFARIFTPFIPCLILIAITDLTVIEFNLIEEYKYRAQVTVEEFFGNLMMLQNRPTVGSIGRKIIYDVNQFGSGRPLWTISFEWWLYMSFGIAYFYSARLKESKILALLIFVAIVPLLNLWSYKVYSGGLTWMWIIGSALFFSRKWARWDKVNPKVLIICMFTFALFSAADFAANVVREGHMEIYNLHFMLMFSICIYERCHMANSTW